MAIDFDDFDEDVLEQASAWVARLRSDQQSESDQQDFALWLAESDQHQKAFDETMVLWEAMSANVAVSDTRLIAASPKSSHHAPHRESGQEEFANNRAYLGKVASPAINQASNDCCQPVPLASLQEPSNKTQNRAKLINRQSWSQQPWSHRSRIKLGGLSVAASLLVIALSVFFFSEKPSGNYSPEIAQQLYATPVGKQQSFTLSDGSILQLSTGTQVTVSFSENKRSLQLLKGEAYFAVSPDPKRPFVVDAGLGEITAIGTAFDIKRSENSVLVAVTHGIVAVADRQESKPSFSSANPQKNPLDNSLSNPVQVGIGKKITVDINTGIGAVENADLEKITAWRKNTLVFRDALLVEALEELNRYLTQPIDLSDQSLQALRISGTFNVGDPNTTFEAIVTSFQLESYNSPITNKTRLYRRTL